MTHNSPMLAYDEKNPIGSASPKRAKKENVLKFTPVFVGGAPRTGTTVLQALLCTADKANPYIGECSYFSAFLQPYIIGLKQFDVHTRHYFTSKDELKKNHGEVLRCELMKIWERLGKPEFLVLKDPLLTPSFHYLAELLESALFIVSVRDPRDTIGSRLEVIKRQENNFPVSYRAIGTLCDEYLNTYQSIIDNRASFGTRLYMVDYEDVVSNKAANTLEATGIGKIRSEAIWDKAVTNVGHYTQNEWFTPLYGQKLSETSVGRHVSTLSPATEAFIIKRCGLIARELGLPMEVSRTLPGDFTLLLDRYHRRFLQLISLRFRHLR